ncbi:MAG: CHASE3 domain-containing protein [Solirubrobacterales bacterium]|nr:CHASE3 domain-containing protein [Solirubrobacterales bacterium]
MRRILRTRITARVVALGAVVAALLGLALVLLIVAVGGLRDAGQAAFRSQEALTAGSELEGSLISIENGLRGFVASGRERFLQPTEEALRDYPGELRRLDRLVSGEPDQQERVERVGVAIEDYVTLWARPLIALARDRLPAAQSVVVTNGGRARLDAISEGFDRLVARERVVSRERELRAEQRSSLAVGFGFGGLALVLALTAGVALYLRRAIVQPVLMVSEATGRLAAGDLGTRVPAERPDEIGDLARSFNAMADSLQSSRSELASRTEELEHSNGELQRSNRELEQFASVTSHDLQAPLTTISMYAELLERRHAGELNGVAELLDGIRGATGQARELIRDLLEYSRAGRGPLHVEEVAVGAVVGQVLESLAGPIDEAGAQVVVASELPVVSADRGNLARVFQNLIGNAIKFTSDRAPEVRIGVERDGARWRFWVRDNGIGMEPQHAERIFEPFQRLHGDEAYEGTGIGLAVCERIVDQQGGRIWAQSVPGEGSIFSFTLPARETAQDEAAVEEARAHAAV